MQAHNPATGARRRIERRIICRAVTRLTVLATAGAAAISLLAAGCGGNIKVPNQDKAARTGAQLFYERCSGCHSLNAGNAFGSKPPGQIPPGERTNGPNFNIRKEKRDDVLFAIRNGGFSGAIMPANVVVGKDAQLVASFIAKYSGAQPTKNETNPGIQQSP
jgi:mono/diheme cytochrome c family protein